MDPIIKAYWVAALRSGKFIQGKQDLCSSDGRFCCLGVLCVVTDNIPEGSSIDPGNENCGFGFDEVLPEDVAKLVGLESVDPKVKVGDDPRLASTRMDSDAGMRTLSALNDSGFTFVEIADIIEAQL